MAFRDFLLARTHFRPFTRVLSQIRSEVTRKVSRPSCYWGSDDGQKGRVLRSAGDSPDTKLLC